MFTQVFTTWAGQHIRQYGVVLRSAVFKYAKNMKKLNISKYLEYVQNLYDVNKIFY